ncbi:MAG TPA: TonB-dependent receptor plug domain-containing protein, partial [Terricaulis sp.]|nr:TonB-dependent receptor plug domain-containing protein [Terricaulis sp.]
MTKRVSSVKQRNILQYSTALGVMAFAALTPGAAMAQAGAEEEDAIVVTGTRIRQPDFEFSNPVASVNAQSIQQSGATNLTDFAQEMPALLSSFDTEASADTGNGGGLQGQNLLDLRSLGTNRTLVLVDGRRHVAGLEGSAAVDINTIPIDMVERIEILTGGASAVYGADGVTGVVNFVMRTDFEGFIVRGQHGWTDQGGGGDEFISALWGTNFGGGRGNIMVGAEYSVTHALDYWERDIIAPGNAEAIISGNIVRGARYIDTSPGGSFMTDCDGDYGFFFTACGLGDPDPGTPSTWTGIDYNGDGSAWVDGTYVGGAFMVGGTGSRLEDFNDQLIPDLDRWTINTRAHYDFSNAFRLIGEFKYAHTETYFVGQPTYDFGAYVFTDNPFMPASIRNAALAPGGIVDQGEPGVIMFRDNFDLGTLDHDVTRDTFRVVIGAEGAITDWLDYNVSYTYGTTVSDQIYRTRNNERWFAGMDVVDNGSGPECRDNSGGETWDAGTCVPINVFGDGAMSQAAIDWVMTNMYNKETITQSVLSGFLSGDTGSFRLPGGPIAFVVGAEYREEESEFDFDDYAQTLSSPEDLFWNGQGIDSTGA